MTHIKYEQNGTVQLKVLQGEKKTFGKKSHVRWISTANIYSTNNIWTDC